MSIRFKYRNEYDSQYMGSFRPYDVKDGKFISGSPDVVLGPDINYHVNDYGFRSQNFDNFNINKFNILFGGDSFTFGDSMPEELCYPYMIKNKLKFYCEVYNTATNGASIQQVVKNTIAFIRKYGKPDFIFLLMPISNRSIFFDKDKEVFHTAFDSIEWVYENESLSLKERKRFYNGFNLEENILKSIDFIRMLEDICNLQEINFLWSTYSEEADLYEKCNFNNFININRVLSIPTKNLKSLPYWEKAKDGIHPGANYHDALSDIISSKINILNGN